MIAFLIPSQLILETIYFIEIILYKYKVPTYLHKLYGWHKFW